MKFTAEDRLKYGQTLWFPKKKGRFKISNYLDLSQLPKKYFKIDYLFHGNEGVLFHVDFKG